MINGKISDFIGKLPAIKITEPYSPVARANIMPEPISNAGYNSGKITRLKVVNLPAPSTDAASSYSGDSSASTGCTARTINGKLTTISANQIPMGVKAILMPNGAKNCPIKPLGAYKVASEIPITAVGKAKGKSTSAFKIDFPQNS